MDIKTYVLQRKAALKAKIEQHHYSPSLVIVQVNDNPASDKYITGKLKDSAEVGIKASLIKLSPLTTEAALLEVINKLNNDPEVHGIIVQLPLPKQIRENIIKNAVNPLKDVDGFHPMSTFKPCTPFGIINYLKSENIVFQGQNAVVLGRSNIVGKPMAALLLAEDANVTILHSKTKKEDMNFYLNHADIIVVAVGKRYFLDSTTLKKSAVVVDVGINVDKNGALCGDVKPHLDVFLQTPVPGGVGLLTRLTLLENVMEAYLHGI